MPSLFTMIVERSDLAKLARKKHPLDAACRDRIVRGVTDARGVVAGLAG
jgi:hypothetical protein